MAGHAACDSCEQAIQEDETYSMAWSTSGWVYEYLSKVGMENTNTTVVVTAPTAREFGVFTRTAYWPGRGEVTQIRSLLKRGKSGAAGKYEKDNGGRPECHETMDRGGLRISGGIEDRVVCLLVFTGAAGHADKFVFTAVWCLKAYDGVKVFLRAEASFLPSDKMADGAIR